MANFSSLDDLLQRKNQRFICKGNRSRPEGFVANIMHEVTPPLDPVKLELLRAQVADVPQLVELYRKYGSVRLYLDTKMYEPWGHSCSAFYIADPEEWIDLKDGFQSWIEDLGKEEAEEILPSWINSYVVIGEIPNSGNYFLVPMTGDELGSVYEFEHDGFEFIKHANSIVDFVSLISTPTDELVRAISGHARYFDGVSDTQWLARHYEFDE